jgi:hypothetical protein
MNQFKSKKLGTGNFKIGDQVIITNYESESLIQFDCTNSLGEIVFYKLGYYTKIKIENYIGYFSDSDFKSV